MIDSLHSSFRRLASRPAADASQIARLQRHFGVVPSEYLQLALQAAEIELQHADGQYIRIWGPAGCIEMDEGYHIQQRIPDSVPIGDDGGGRIICYHQGNRGFGLYHVGYGALDPDETTWIAPSLTDFLTKGVGIETF